jgi:hypothetical protein
MGQPASSGARAQAPLPGPHPVDRPRREPRRPACHGRARAGDPRGGAGARTRRDALDCLRPKDGPMLVVGTTTARPAFSAPRCQRWWLCRNGSSHSDRCGLTRSELLIARVVRRRYRGAGRRSRRFPRTGRERVGRLPDRARPTRRVRRPRRGSRPQARNHHVLRQAGRGGSASPPAARKRMSRVPWNFGGGLMIIRRG